MIRERAVSPNTIAAYRDTMQLLLCFASDQLRKEPSRIDIGDLDADFDRRVPRAPQTRPRLQRTNPQLPAHRDSIAAALRRTPPPRTRPRDRTDDTLTLMRLGIGYRDVAKLVIAIERHALLAADNNRDRPETRETVTV